MTRHNSIGKLALAILLLAAASAPFASATTYTFVTQSEGVASVDWHDSDVWSPSGVPNAVGDVAIFVRPTVVPSVPFFVVLDQDTTVGAITINNDGFNQNQNLIIDLGGTLTFEDASGTATLTETQGGSSAGRLDIQPNINLNSDLLVTQNNRADLNSSSFLRGVITGGTNRTLTKTGAATWQLEHHGASGFQGQYVIDQGALRFTGSTNIAQSTGVTVNAGGQLQFNATSGGPEFHSWSLASGAMLTLNGQGRTGLAGALRFQGAAGQDPRTSQFGSPVEFASDTRIGTGPAAVTGELTNTVTGAGGLIKNGPGTLVLSNAGNGYLGNTTIEGGAGILSFSHPTLADNADVLFLANNSSLNLNYTGTDTIRSFFIAGVQQDAGIWGAVGNLAADFTTERITGNGLLLVTAGPIVGLTGDYNDDGVVDAADYVVWRQNEGTSNVLPNDPVGGTIGQGQYDNWTANFGSSSPGGASLSAVPEPAALLLALIGLLAAGCSRRRAV